MQYHFKNVELNKFDNWFEGNKRELEYTTIIFAKREEIFEFCFKGYSEPPNLKDGEVRKPCTAIKAIYKFKKPMKS